MCNIIVFKMDICQKLLLNQLLKLSFSNSYNYLIKFSFNRICDLFNFAYSNA